MTADRPARLADAAAPTRPTRHDDYVWHFVMHRAGRPPRTGERLGTLVLAPADVAGYGLAALVADGIEGASTARQLATGVQIVDRAAEAERREWVRKLTRAGYVDGWGVAIVRERGRRRTLFRGIPALAGARLAIPAGGIDA